MTATCSHRQNIGCNLFNSKCWKLVFSLTGHFLLWACLIEKLASVSRDYMISKREKRKMQKLRQRYQSINSVLLSFIWNNIHVYFCAKVNKCIPLVLKYQLFFNKLVPCQWGSRPDSHANKLIIILQYDEGCPQVLKWPRRQRTNKYCEATLIIVRKGAVHNYHHFHL